MIVIVAQRLYERFGVQRLLPSILYLESSEGGEDRIVNGAEAETQPWLASIAEKQRGGYFIHCGGALINRRYVL